MDANGDVSRAFLEAEVTRDVCIELPEEDLTEADKRKKHMV